MMEWMGREALAAEQAVKEAARKRRLLRIILRESATLLELPRLLLATPRLWSAPRGAGEPVLVVPGFGSSDRSTVALRAYLRFLGYDAHGWGFGRNHGHVEADIPRIAELVAERARAAGQPVRLIGWSLGGVLAREAARLEPRHVACVITLGSPVKGGPKYTAVAPYWTARGYDLDVVEREIERQNRVPLPVPITAIFSRGDAVVESHACIDTWNRHTEHREVKTTHLGFGFSPDVWTIVAERLHRPSSCAPGNGRAVSAARVPPRVRRARGAAPSRARRRGRDAPRARPASR